MTIGKPGRPRKSAGVVVPLADYAILRQTAPKTAADELVSAEVKPLRGLRATILRHRWHSSDSSRVISGDPSINTVFLVGPQIPATYPVREGVPLVVLAQTAPGYIVARPAPVSPFDYGYSAYQAGGAYIVQDGCWEEWQDVFGHSLPIPLHDYTERKRDR